MEEEIKKQLDFLIEIDKMKTVFRRSYIYTGGRRENDAEHSWHVAVMAMVLADCAGDRDMDLNKVIRMLLVHDLIEVYAGDTFAYDAAGNLDKKSREEAAADRLYALLPGDQGARYRALWEEFDREETPEAKYAAAMDRLQPLISNWLNQGATWREGHVALEQVWRRMAPVKTGTPRLWGLVEEIVTDAAEKGYIQ